MQLEEALDRWFRILFESFPDPFVLFDSAGYVVAANPRAEELLGRARPELLGSPVGLVLPALNLEERAGIVGAAAERTEIRHPDGAIVPIEISLASFESGGQRWILARLASRASPGAPSDAASPAVLMPDFLATLMHELRTPLQAMLSWTQFLRAGARDDQTIQNALASIERNIHWEAQVLDDLLELSEIVSGNVRLDMRATRAAAVIASAVEQVSPSARSKRVSLVQTLEVEEDEIFAETADAIRSEQAAIASPAVHIEIPTVAAPHG